MIPLNVRKQAERRYHMIQHMRDFLTSQGYHFLPANKPEIMVYYRNDQAEIEVIHMIDSEQKMKLSPIMLQSMKEKITLLFREKGYRNIEILTVIISNETDEMKELTKSDTACWIVDEKNGKLMIFENQKNGFLHIKEYIEKVLEKEDGTSEESFNQKYSSENIRNILFKKKETPVTYIITMINVIVFIACLLTGTLFYEYGAINAVRFFYFHEYYRLLSSLFLHGDIQHLVGNMLFFFFLGEIVERELGSRKYLLLYFLSGICGSILSMAYSSYLKTFTDSIGASGAIFGVVGGLLWIVLRNKGKVESISLGKILFLVIFSLYSGLISTNVDNAAHFGGFIAGLLLAIALYHKKRKIEQKEEE